MKSLWNTFAQILISTSIIVSILLLLIPGLLCESYTFSIPSTTTLQHSPINNKSPALDKVALLSSVIPNILHCVPTPTLARQTGETTTTTLATYFCTSQQINKLAIIISVCLAVSLSPLDNTQLSSMSTQVR